MAFFPCKGCTDAAFPARPPIASSSAPTSCLAADARAPSEEEEDGCLQSFSHLPGSKSTGKSPSGVNTAMGSRLELLVPLMVGPVSSPRADPIPSSQLLAEEQNHKEEATSKPKCGLKRKLRIIPLLRKWV